jgi:hypothetical protein
LERDSYLKNIYYDKISAVYLSGREKYYLSMAAVPRDQVYFLPDRPIEGIKIQDQLELVFNYRGQLIRFSIKVAAFKVGIIVADKPEFLYKDLGRSHNRVALPQGMKVRLKYREEHYALEYPKISRYEPVGMPETELSADITDLSGFMQKLFIWARHVADGCRMFLFNDVKPSRLEERIIAETGLILYLPSSRIGLPKIFPYLVSGIVTQKLFLGCLRRAGFDPNRLEDAMGNYLESKSKKGIHSEAWVPILFHEYVLGYIHAWTRDGSPRLLENATVETLRQYAKIIAYSLKAHGYFESWRLPDKPVDGEVANISASGMLFSSLDTAEASAMRPGVVMKVKLETFDRIVTIGKTRVIRRSKVDSTVYVGCQFMDMDGEDREFLLEYIYGKEVKSEGAVFLTGQV